MFQRYLSLKFLPVIIFRIWFLIGDVWRYYFLYLSFKRIGRNVSIARFTSFGGLDKLEIGDNVSINQGCNLYADYGILIGKNTKLSPNVHLYSANYIYKKGEIIGSMGTTGSKITIGENVWIGAGSVILPGVSVGDNSIIGALSLVSKNIPSGELWAGNPVKFIKNIT